MHKVGFLNLMYNFESQLSSENWTKVNEVGDIMPTLHGIGNQRRSEQR